MNVNMYNRLNGFLFQNKNPVNAIKNRNIFAKMITWTINHSLEF